MTAYTDTQPAALECQKAPSAKRGIKTSANWEADKVGTMQVRKHRAPKGALRHGTERIVRIILHLRQKAPSAKRCIKTPARQRGSSAGGGSESTEHQKVH